jgi:hypothetical protein
MLNPERNVVWRALNSVDYQGTLTQEEKEFIMSITGTVIFYLSDPTDTTPPKVMRVDPVKAGIDDLVNAVKGDGIVSNPSMEIYKCIHKPSAAPEDSVLTSSNNCLSVSKTQTTLSTSGGFLFKLQTAKNTIVASIRSRLPVRNNPSLINVYGLIHSASNLPLLKIIQASASTKNSMMSDSLVNSFLDIAATQMAIRYLRFALDAIEQARGFIASTNSQTDKEAMLLLMERYKQLSKNLDVRESLVNQQLAALNDSLKIYESVQRYMHSTLSADMSRSLNFGR